MAMKQLHPELDADYALARYAWTNALDDDNKLKKSTKYSDKDRAFIDEAHVSGRFTDEYETQLIEAYDKALKLFTKVQDEWVAETAKYKEANAEMIKAYDEYIKARDAEAFADRLDEDLTVQRAPVSKKAAPEKAKASVSVKGKTPTADKSKAPTAPRKPVFGASSQDAKPTSSSAKAQAPEKSKPANGKRPHVETTKVEKSNGAPDVNRKKRSKIAADIMEIIYTQMNVAFTAGIPLLKDYLRENDIA
jgi:hypothetical protein